MRPCCSVFHCTRRAADANGPSSGVLDPSCAMHVLVVAALLVTSTMLVLTPDDNDLVETLRLLLLVYCSSWQPTSCSLSR